MLKNYLKIAWRNIYHHFTYSAINILGLAIGLASAIVISLWVWQEWSYDRHFEDADQIYRVGVNFMNIGDMAVGPPQLNDYVRDLPEVEQTARLNGVSSLDIFIGDRAFEQPNVFYADPTFFDLFSYDFVGGSRVSALDQPGSAVLTTETADRLFGSQPAMGKTIRVGEDKDAYTVVGVVDTNGNRSHINPTMWLNYTYRYNSNWLSANVYNYVKLNETARRDDLERRLRQLVKERVYPSLSLNVPYEEWETTDGAYRFITMPVTDIYLKSNLRFEATPGGSYSNVIAFAGIAILIILIAAVNFINITTARSSIRAKEVGIRKTLGTGRGALVGQFLFEAVLLSGIALIISFGLGELFLMGFEKFTGQQLLEGLFIHSGAQILTVSAVALVIGLLAGIYPALYLTRFKPVTVLKGQVHSQTGDKSLFRNGLVLVQFTISIGLLIGTGVIYQQLQFMQTKDLGLNKENVLVINNADDLGNRKEAFREELLRQNGVEAASFNRRIPAGASVWVSAMKTRKMTEDLPLQSFIGDYEMIPTLGFRIIEGRNFSRDVAADTNAVLLNQSAVTALGFNQPLGSTLSSGRQEYRVIGVVADFNYESLRKNIEPTVIEFAEDGARLAIKIDGDNQKEIVDFARARWMEFGAEAAINYYFLDQNFQQMLEKENILAKAVVIFTLLAIIISCLGLYGLSAFITEQRTKEIGIRRVLGATPYQILAMLYKNFTKPVILAVMIAFPVTFILSQRWLSNFAYKTELDIWVFIGAGVSAVAVALITVSYQSLKTVMRNPVESLRSE